MKGISHLPKKVKFIMECKFAKNTCKVLASIRLLADANLTLTVFANLHYDSLLFP